MPPSAPPCQPRNSAEDLTAHLSPVSPGQEKKSQVPMRSNSDSQEVQVERAEFLLQLLVQFLGNILHSSCGALYSLDSFYKTSGSLGNQEVANNSVRSNVRGWLSPQEREKLKEVVLSRCRLPESFIVKAEVDRAVMSPNPQNEMGLFQQDLENSHNEDDSGFGSCGLAFFKNVHDSTDDIERLEKNSLELKESKCYYEGLDSPGARNLLRNAKTGTFLIRDSFDSRYLYSLSVKTHRGATSVRIQYRDGLFQFDSDERIKERLPRFETVLGLIDFHVTLCREGNDKSWRWEENPGKKDMHVILTKPLRHSIPSLAHLSRVTINESVKNRYIPQVSIDKLPVLHEQMKIFTKNYPYKI